MSGEQPFTQLHPRDMPEAAAFAAGERQLREEIVQEAMSWLGTPWHHEARVKGAGVDCAQFLIGVYSAVGMIPAFQPEHYPPDWHLHQEDQRFLQIVLQHCREVSEGKRGDVVMFKLGKHAAHGAILLSPEMIIHAWHSERQVVLYDLPRSPLAERVAGYYRWKGFP